MTPNRPYFLRAVNEWILDNDLTPHLLVDATVNGVQVPEQFIDDGKIILNISPTAIEQAEFSNEWILFSARFSGKAYRIEFPMEAVIAIYAKENGRGMVFPEEAEIAENEDVRPSEEKVSNKKPDTDRPHLTIVK